MQVALMFLVRGDIHHEASWTQWIGNVANILPPSIACNDEARGCYTKMLDKQKPAKSIYDEQTFFTIYVHTKTDYPGYQKGSIFDGRVVDPLIQVLPFLSQ